MIFLYFWNIGKTENSDSYVRSVFLIVKFNEPNEDKLEGLFNFSESEKIIKKTQRTLQCEYLTSPKKTKLGILFIFRESEKVLKKTPKVLSHIFSPSHPKKINTIRENTLLANSEVFLENSFVHK